MLKYYPKTISKYLFSLLLTLSTAQLLIIIIGICRCIASATSMVVEIKIIYKQKFLCFSKRKPGASTLSYDRCISLIGFFEF